jgi:hypothetical protein
LSASTFANCCPFWTLQLRMQMLYLSLYDIMTHSHFNTWHHNKISKAHRASNMTLDSKSVHLTHFQRLLICNLFLWNTSHSHDNLRIVSKSPLLHPFTRRRSGTLDWCVMKATLADSSRLIHTILAHSSIALFYCTLLLFYISLSLSIFCRHRTPSIAHLAICQGLIWCQPFIFSQCIVTLMLLDKLMIDCCKCCNG